MRYTGLPQNFDVVEAAVPNAAAAIVPGPDGLPRRVIAYNREFLRDLVKATSGNDWAPVSVMAHEIGHHLSGHTILPGGSAPLIELEADKFSGFVLFKMGAGLEDAQRAIDTLVGEAPSRTHPGRRDRSEAIREGWTQACAQRGGACDVREAQPGSQPALASGAAAQLSAPPISRPVQNPDNAGAGRAAVLQGVSSSAAQSPAAQADGHASGQLPLPQASAIPAKFDRFVFDETGRIAPQHVEQLAERLRRHAQQSSVEVVVLVSNSFHGLQGDDYARAMLRQLRVGQLDLGNGAVLAVSPNERRVGLAMGAAVGLELADYADLVRDGLQAFADNHDACAACASEWFGSMEQATQHMVARTRDWDFALRFASLDALLAAAQQEAAVRDAAVDWDPETSRVWRALVQIDAVLVDPNLDADSDQPTALDDAVSGGGRNLTLDAGQGRRLLAHLDPQIESLMPTRIQAGKRHIFILRERDVDGLRFDVVSFTAMP